MKTILIVDDEPRTRQGIRKTLEAWSSGRHRFVTASSGVEALDWLEKNEANLLVTDIRMPEIGGLDLVEKLRGWLILPLSSSFPATRNSITRRRRSSSESSNIY